MKTRPVNAVSEDLKLERNSDVVLSYCHWSLAT